MCAHIYVFLRSFRNFVVIVQKSADACKNSRSHSSVSNVDVRAEISAICLFSCIVLCEETDIDRLHSVHTCVCVKTMRVSQIDRIHDYALLIGIQYL